MSTIGSNFTFGAAGTEDTLYGFSYANIKTAAGESSDTDAFLLNSVVAGNLYYNAGSTAAPKYFKITDFTSSGGGVQIRLAGVFINNVKVNGTDAKVYWMPEGSGGTQNGDGSVATFGAPTNANGNTAAFTVQAVDNVDGIFGAGLNGSGVGNDTVSTGTPATASINLTAVNDAPVIAGGATAVFGINENQAAVTTILGTDVDGNTLTYTLSGSDASKFQINATGVLTFLSPPDFEAPTDVGMDNVYNLIVTANDGQNQANSTTTQAIAVTVGNINDAPVNTVPLAQVADSARHVTFGGTLAVTDQDVADTLTTTVSVLHGTFTSTGISGAAIGTLGSSTLTISGTAAEVTAALNGLQYTGNVGFGSDTLTVTTTDGHGGVDTDTVNITPGIASVVSVGVPADGAYSAASSLDFTVNFDQAVTVTGNPRLELNVGGSVVFATYVSGSGSTQLVFNYVVQPGQNDGNGIDVVNLSLNGGAIANAAEVNASLVLNGLASTAHVIIDTAAPAAGALSFASLVDTGASGTDHITKDGTFDLSLNGQEQGTTVVYQVSANGGAWTATTSAQSELADGSYSFRAVATDAAGNASTTEAISVVIDNTAPAAAALTLASDSGFSAADAITNSGVINVAGLEANSTWQYAVDEGNWQTGSGSSLTVAADGVHNVVVRQTDQAGNVSEFSSLGFTLDTVAPQTKYLSAIYDASNGDVLTLTGTNVGDLLVTEGDFGADVFASLDFSKMGWDLNGDGTIDISLAGQVQSAFVTDNQTLQIVLDGDFAAALEDNPAFGTAGGSAIDKLVIQNGFSTDLAGNVSSGDGVTLQIMGALNEAGMPMVFGADFGGDQSTGYLHNETLGINVQPSYGKGPYVQSVVFQKFDASVDTLHVTAPTSAASLDFVSFSQGVALAQPSNDYQHFGSGSGFAVVLEGANITGASGIRDSSVISFDDGSVLRTNSTGISATLSGGGQDDLLMAGSGGDRLLGNAGDDRLIGGSGNDHIYGGNGNDVIYGGGGSDYLVGGSGQDTFVFNDAEGVHATIADFSISDDQLLFDLALQPVATASGSDTLLTFGSGSTIRLLGVSADAFGGGSAPQANIDHGGVFFAGGQNIFSGFEYS